MIDKKYEVYNIKDIVEELQKMDESKENDKRGKKDNTDLETSIRKSFTYILKNKLELSQEEIGWFKEKSDKFIFQADKYTLMYLDNILDIFGRKNAVITPSEEQSLIEDFARILPYPILKGDVRACIDTFNARAYRIEQAVRDYYRRSQEANLYRKRLFVKIDVKIEPDKEKRRGFYKNQYELIKGWKEKWMSVMEKARGIRKAERMECLYRCKIDGIFACTKKDEEDFYKTGKLENEMIQRVYKEMKIIRSQDLYQYVLWLFITGDQEEKQADNATQEDIRRMDGCIEACTSLFSEVITQQLKNDSMEDYEYMIKKAIKELEDIKKILMQDYEADKRRKKSLYPEVEMLRHRDRLSKTKIFTEKDLQNLSNIRRHLNEIENEKNLVIDYIN